MRQLKKLRIVDKSSKLYKDIGTKLLTTAALVDSISEVANEDPKKAIRLIYRRWIRTDEGHSWRKLTQCFKDVGLNSLARDLEKHFELPSLSGKFLLCTCIYFVFVYDSGMPNISSLPRQNVWPHKTI